MYYLMENFDCVQYMVFVKTYTIRVTVFLLCKKFVRNKNASMGWCQYSMRRCKVG
jgi:hypothetical protein